ncbi:MAG: hypothetical protein IPK68_09105 [Bdellovibrionales bacterium]|nr:hypothetical protein [Bdellovibrionales bacterium]
MTRQILMVKPLHDNNNPACFFVVETIRPSEVKVLQRSFAVGITLGTFWIVWIINNDVVATLTRDRTFNADSFHLTSFVIRKFRFLI